MQAILVTLLWSTSWVLIKIGLRNSLPAITFAGLRYTLAFLCLSPFVLLNPSPLQWIGIGLAILGVGVYFFPISMPDAQIVGVGIGLFCMLMNMASSLFSREVNRGGMLPALVVTFVSMGIGSVLMLITGLVVQGSGTLTGQDWVIIAWMAVANTALAFTLWNRSLQILTAVESSILNSLMMPQIAILAFVFLGERLILKDIVGLALVGIGTLVVQLKLTKNM
jgi:drug/metabolite transporter (DMT)-like permease